MVPYPNTTSSSSSSSSSSAAIVEEDSESPLDKSHYDLRICFYWRGLPILLDQNMNCTLFLPKVSNRKLMTEQLIKLKQLLLKKSVTYTAPGRRVAYGMPRACDGRRETEF